MDLVLKINKQDFEILQEHNDFQKLEADIIETSAFDGTNLTAILIPLTTITINYIGKIIVELIKARKSIEVNIDGNLIKGLDAKNTLKILNEIYKQETVVQLDKSKTTHNDKNKRKNS